MSEPQGAANGEWSISKRDSLDLFPTPVEVIEIDGMEDLNAHVVRNLGTYFPELKGDAHYQHAYDWTSSADLHWRDQGLGRLVDAFIDLARSWCARSGLICDDLVVTELWANLAAPGGATYRHHHRGAYLAGVYYPVVGPATGDLILHDPRGNRVQVVPTGLREPGNSFSLAPSVGTMVMFPAWLDHSVGQNLSNEDRVSIACNIVPLGEFGSSRAPRRARVTFDET